ncbi:Uncharacterised protein family (UPF0259) [Bacillus freudenreichii]|nr:Uncharacterised protein family (UPF0259) [Bacillus freudenreichii]
MDKPISFAFSVFVRKYERYLLIAFLVQIPLLILHSFLTNYIYAVTPSGGSLLSVADIYYAFVTMVLLIYAMVPFIKFTANEFEGHENPLKNAFYTFAVQGFNIFAFSVLISLLTVIGFMFLIIPGLVILAAFISAPIIAVIDEKSVWKSMKESFQIFKKHSWKIILFISLLSLLELIIGIALNFLLFSITDSYAAVVISQIFLNTIFFPVFGVVLTSLVIKWREGLNSLEVKDEAVV